MRFSDSDVNRRTRKDNFLDQIDHLIDCKPIETAIADIKRLHPMLRVGQFILGCLLVLLS